MPNTSRPYVISWNLTHRCNLSCDHCYLDAGAEMHRRLEGEGFADRGELATEDCFKVIDQIADFAPEAVTILTGGEPLLRPDIMELIRYGAEKNLWVVCGSNGVMVTEKLAGALKEAGLRGMALSLDSLSSRAHDKFRGITGAYQGTIRGAGALNRAGLPFIIQTTVNRYNFTEIEDIADFAHLELQAKVFNLYFLVATGRGQFVSDINLEEYEMVLQSLKRIQEKYSGRMMVNAKCAPHYQRLLFESDSDSPFLKTFADGAGGCPAGMQYMGIRPNGDMTPCPYLPKFGGNVLEKSIREIWQESALFQEIRQRGKLAGDCGRCEFSDVCGGCRARAFGSTGDYMEEDYLCEYDVGSLDREEIRKKFQVTYGQKTPQPREASDTPQGPLGGAKGKNPPGDNEAPEGAPNPGSGDMALESVEWEPEARASMEKVPAFVRGMVLRRVESYCRNHGIARITTGILQEIRSRMPSRSFFSAGNP